MPNDIYSIYLITNLINNKKYIGFSQDPYRRWQHHICLANTGSGYYLHRSMRKYGIENFELSTIYQSKDQKHCLNEMEIFFINEYHTNNPELGYNLTLGGDGTFGRIVSAETRKKLSVAGSNHSEESRKKIGEANSKRKQSDETKKKLSDIMKNIRKTKKWSKLTSHIK